MKTPSDGWDPDERDVLESAMLGPQFEAARARHVLDPTNEARLLSRIKREALRETRARSQRWPRWGTWLAAASVILIAGAFSILPRRDGAAPDARTPPPTAAVTPSPAPVFYLPLDVPAVKVSPASLEYRGPAGENPLLADLKPAFDAFRAGDYSGADRAFSAIAAHHPTAVEIPFYQGTARLLGGNAPGAIASFTAAERLADRAFSWDVAWYHAVAEERAGNLTGARARLVTLCAQPDARASRACDALSRLPAGRVPPA